MTELELTRTPDDRRLYSLDGIGTVRLEGLFSNSATAEAAERGWRFARRGFTAHYPPLERAALRRRRPHAPTGLGFD